MRTIRFYAGRACSPRRGCATAPEALRRRAPGPPGLISEAVRAGLHPRRRDRSSWPGCRSTPGRRLALQRACSPVDPGTRRGDRPRRELDRQAGRALTDDDLTALEDLGGADPGSGSSVRVRQASLATRAGGARLRSCRRSCGQRAARW
ncbi:hypothetical protein HBB16_03080 [Pseudonocardia sp. MCCB 268]|nr:hypothetical protein [Pseudonocardia cytotoxica]